MSARLTSHDRFLRVHFEDGHHADYHWFWLRHECALERHPLTGERTLSMADVPLDVQAREVRLEDDVVIDWEGLSRAPSRYPLAWLREHAYALDREDPAVETELAQYVAEAATARALPLDFRARLARDGAIVVPAPDGAARPEHTERLIEELGPAGFTVIGTHFGRIEDLRTDNTTNQNTDQLGYTDAGVDLHTDQPFLPSPPRFQLLHAIQPAPRGGESLFADATLAARWLGATDAHALELLTTTPVHFHRKQKAFERLHVGPILTPKPDGTFHVRSSYFTMAPHRLPFARMEAFYRAYQTLFRYLAEPAHHVRFALRAGDVLFYDNHRMLHGRTAFEGTRWVRGVYFDET